MTIDSLLIDEKYIHQEESTVVALMLDNQGQTFPGKAILNDSF